MINVSPGERVLISGATGSLGHALIPAFLAAGARVLGLSRDENKGAELRRKFPDVEHRIGDVRDPRAVFLACLGMETVIHAASLKYVSDSERQPSEYVQTNVVGTMNVLDACQRSDTVRRVVGISTDKACGQIKNVYGLTKALLEKLFIEAHLYAEGGHPRNFPRTRQPDDCSFVVARYGNVWASRGSVVPFWAEQRRKGEPLTVTDPSMTRFFFTLDDAVKLVDVALAAPSGTIVAQPMPAATLGQLAAVMAPRGRDLTRSAGVGRTESYPLDGPAFVVVGRRPGEKVHEELLTAEEMARTERIAASVAATRETGWSSPGDPRPPDHFLYSPLASPHVGRVCDPYTSDCAPRLTDDSLRAMLKEWL